MQLTAALFPRLHRLGGLALLAALLAGCRSPSPPAPAPAGPPIGHLGRPIGTYLRIEGLRHERGKVGNRVLDVDRVNGEPLDPPVALWIQNLPLPQGVRCRIAGYETGRWLGLPPEVQLAEGLPLQQAGWQLWIDFIVTSVQEPADLAAQLEARDSR